MGAVVGHAPMAGLQARWDPYVEHADVDRGDNDGSTDHDVPGAATVGDDDADAVDDNLQ